MTKIAVIGAGLSGIVVASGLVEQGFKVRVFEKSRGIGGRLSTRRVRDEAEAKGVEFDHGAPAVHAQSPAFHSFLDKLAGAGAVADWPDAAAIYNGDSAAYFVGVPAMNKLIHPFANKIDVRLQATVKSVDITDGRVLITYEDGDGAQHCEDFDLTVISAPAPQTAVMAASIADIAGPAEAVCYAPCWTVMLALRNGVITQSVSAPMPNIEKIICNTAKPRRSDNDPLTAYVVHATTEWTEANIDATREQVLAELTPQILRILSSDAVNLSGEDIAYAAAHRWLYARTSKPVGKPFLATDDRKVFAVGDWCLGPNAEDAFISAQACLSAMEKGYAAV